VSGHAYTVLGHVVLSNGTKLVKMRNPWGSEKFHGRWSDDSNLWTEQFKQEAGWVKANDGVFFMQLEDYKVQVSHTFINHDTTGWGSDHFLMTNDTSNSPGSYSWCGSSCTRHTFTLKSEATEVQDIYLTGHTWDKRGSPGSCGVDNVTHSIDHTSAPSVRTWSSGSTQLAPFKLQPGETTQVTVEMDFRNAAVAKDWSVVAYGDKGKVTLTHNGGKTTGSLPLIQRQEG